MRAVDTNILVRLIARDHPAQLATAERLLAEGFIISATTLMESEWVLRAIYGFSRTDIADGFTDLLDSETVEATDPSSLRWAIKRYRLGADLADMLHLCAFPSATGFATFDTKLARRAGKDSLLAVETLS